MNAKAITGTGIAAIIAVMVQAGTCFADRYECIPIRHYGVNDTYDPEEPR